MPSPRPPALRRSTQSSGNSGNGGGYGQMPGNWEDFYNYPFFGNRG